MNKFSSTARIKERIRYLKPIQNWPKISRYESRKVISRTLLSNIISCDNTERSLVKRKLRKHRHHSRCLSPAPFSNRYLNRVKFIEPKSKARQFKLKSKIIFNTALEIYCTVLPPAARPRPYHHRLYFHSAFQCQRAFD